MTKTVAFEPNKGGEPLHDGSVSLPWAWCWWRSAR